MAIVTAATPPPTVEAITTAASANNCSPSVRSNCSGLSSINRQDSNDSITTANSGRINASYQTPLPPHYQPPSPSITPLSASQLPAPPPPSDTHAIHTLRGHEEAALSTRVVNAAMDTK